MAGTLTLPQRDGRVRRGLCSHYLRGLEPGAEVRVALKPAPRRLPEGFAGPLLLVGAGTGLAPLYGMLEDRAARGLRGAGAGPAALYFGCRSPAELLQRRELTQWRLEGHLARLGVAFSRNGGAKAYVQDAIDADGGRVWDLLRRPDARLVICGDARMAQEVEERLLQVVRREGGMSYSAAFDLLQDMRGEGRLIEDVWGVQLNREVALPEMVRARYDRGARWLARLQRALTGRAPQAGSILLM
jgi:sulfite reductase alpha subunit-like flavoprotein